MRERIVTAVIAALLLLCESYLAPTRDALPSRAADAIGYASISDALTTEDYATINTSLHNDDARGEPDADSSIPITPDDSGGAAYTDDSSSITYRALLIACDEYVAYPDMTPTAHNNLLAMESMLERDQRGFIISRQDGITQSAEALQSAINYAFKDADDDDISYLYISAHGDFNARFPNPQGELILSDGIEEVRVNAQTLQSMLDPIPGTKLLIVDACNSGALIGKGISLDEAPERLGEAFTSPSYKALMSSGGSEPSWYWRTDSGGPPLSSSYFTMALVEGAGYYGEYPADADKNGSITLAELYKYLRVSYAAATVQVTPLDDGFVVFQYDALLDAAGASGEASARTAPLSGFTFNETVLSASSPEITFSFTVSEPTRVGYQLVFMRGGLWDWHNAQVWLDTNDAEVNPNAASTVARSDGTISPGHKTRTLSFGAVTETDWGYALLNIVRYENGRPIVSASRVIAIQPRVGDPRLTIKSSYPGATTASGYDPQKGTMTIWVGHAFPVTLNIAITQWDDDDLVTNTIRWLAQGEITRPQGLTPAGSVYYWDGRDENGDQVADGIYKLIATTTIGQLQYSAVHIFSVGK